MVNMRTEFYSENLNGRVHLVQPRVDWKTYGAQKWAELIRNRWRRATDTLLTL